MAAEILDGKKMSESLRKEIAERVGRLKEQGVTPGLAVILVGNDPASEIYVRNKGNGCAETGMYSRTIQMPEETTQEQLEAAEAALGDETVYWAPFGKVYHTHEDCGALNHTETLTAGSVEQAVASNRTRLCSFCAAKDNITGVVTDSD